VADLDREDLPPVPVTRVSAMSALRRRPGPGTMSYGHEIVWALADRPGFQAGLEGLILLRTNLLRTNLLRTNLSRTSLS
jgi:hypothetical protein